MHLGPVQQALLGQNSLAVTDKMGPGCWLGEATGLTWMDEFVLASDSLIDNAASIHYSHAASDANWYDSS